MPTARKMGTDWTPLNERQHAKRSAIMLLRLMFTAALLVAFLWNSPSGKAATGFQMPPGGDRSAGEMWFQSVSPTASLNSAGLSSLPMRSQSMTSWRE